MQHLISEKEIPDDEYAPDPKLTEHLFPFKNVFIASGYPADIVNIILDMAAKRHKKHNDKISGLVIPIE
jgi:hypothetical protein